MLKVPDEKKVRINSSLLLQIKKARKKSLDNDVIYSSDKQFVEIAVIKLLKKEGIK